MQAPNSYVTHYHYTHNPNLNQNLNHTIPPNLTFTLKRASPALELHCKKMSLTQRFYVLTFFYMYNNFQCFVSSRHERPTLLW